LGISNATVAVIPARGGSKAIPRKNIHPVLGVPLIAWTIRQVADGGVGEIFVSTDDFEIAAVARAEGAQIITRPLEIAGDKATSESALIHAANELELGDETILLMPQVTSPVRRAKDVSDIVELVRSGGYDSAFSGTRIDNIGVWKASDGPAPITYDLNARAMRQDSPPLVVENGSLYCMRVGVLRGNGSRVGGKIGILEMPNWTLHEIDEPGDVRLCEVLMSAFLNLDHPSG
jgi:N-acylneuraminate cytidylyltransferase